MGKKDWRPGGIEGDGRERSDPGGKKEQSVVWMVDRGQGHSRAVDCGQRQREIGEAQEELSKETPCGLYLVLHLAVVDNLRCGTWQTGVD